MSKDHGALNERPFVMVGPHGLAYVGIHASERDCWQVALGWPSDDEIAARKAEGFAVHPATLSWNTDARPQAYELAQAIKVLLCDTEESDYMTGREREQHARKLVAEYEGGLT